MGVDAGRPLNHTKRQQKHQNTGEEKREESAPKDTRRRNSEEKRGRSSGKAKGCFGRGGKKKHGHDKGRGRGGRCEETNTQGSSKKMKRDREGGTVAKVSG